MLIDQFFGGGGFLYTETSKRNTALRKMYPPKRKITAHHYFDFLLYSAHLFLGTMGYLQEVSVLKWPKASGPSEPPQSNCLYLLVPFYQIQLTINSTPPPPPRRPRSGFQPHNPA